MPDLITTAMSDPSGMYVQYQQHMQIQQPWPVNAGITWSLTAGPIEPEHNLLLLILEEGE